MESTHEQWQRADELEQQFHLLAALQRIDRAGFHDEALLLAFHGGVLQQFKQDLEQRFWSLFRKG